MDNEKNIKEAVMRAYTRYPESTEALSWLVSEIRLYEDNKITPHNNLKEEI